MDQGPVRPPPPTPWSRRDVAELARAVGVVWLVALVAVASLAWAWVAFSELSPSEVVTPSALIVAALLPLFGIVSRAMDASTKGWTDTATVGRRNAFFGDMETAGLTTVGVFLFVSVPLALLATVLFG